MYRDSIPLDVSDIQKQYFNKARLRLYKLIGDHGVNIHGNQSRAIPVKGEELY